MKLLNQEEPPAKLNENGGNKIIKYVSLDSEFFGKRVADVENFPADSFKLNVILDKCFSDKIDCLYAQTNINDYARNSLALKNGFIPVDVKITLEANIKKPSVFEPAYDVSEYDDSVDLKILKQIVDEASLFGRYFTDPFFRPKSKAFYRTFIENSCSNESTDSVLIASRNSIPIGFLTAQQSKGIIDIRLLSVLKEFQKSGVGSQLIDNLFKKFGNITYKVVTQANNYGALALYTKKGFKIVSSKIFYHKWFTQ